jgi:asparagine synthase (glutamine-hydrolysing)
MNRIANAVVPVPLAEAPGVVFLSHGRDVRQTRVFRDGDLRLVLDGEIYEESGFSSEDTEKDQALKVLRLYEKEGLSFLQKLVGSFYLALWDPTAGQLVLAVDPFATRPLYYSSEKGVIAFASKISNFSICPEVPKEIDPNIVYFYLNHSFVPAPYTIYRHIRRLQPGQFLLWKRGQLSLHQYWDMTYHEDKGMGEKEAARLIGEALEQSVRLRIRYGSARNGQIGAFLSGGTDSSTLVGLMTRIAGGQIKTFSIGFDEEPYNEIEYARIAASHFDSHAYEHFVQSREAFEVVPFLAKVYDEPFGNSSAIPTYFCLRMAREAGVEVMFAGDGGDELFGGNERYLTEKKLSLYQETPWWIRGWTDSVAGHLPSVFPFVKVRNYIRRSNLPNPDRFFSYELYLHHHASEFFTEEFRKVLDPEFPLSVPRNYYQRASAAGLINRLLYMDLKLAIGDNDLFKVNRMAEALGLRVRYPYLDQRLAALTAKIPVHLKIKGFQKRYIFKKAFGEILPHQILSKKKHGFGLPTGYWLRTDSQFKDLARSLLLDARSLQRGYFKRNALERLLRTHEEEKSNYYGSIIWNIMMLELWHRNHAA